MKTITDLLEEIRSLRFNIIGDTIDLSSEELNLVDQTQKAKNLSLRFLDHFLLLDFFEAERILYRCKKLLSEIENHLDFGVFPTKDQFEDKTLTKSGLINDLQATFICIGDLKTGSFDSNFLNHLFDVLHLKRRLLAELLNKLSLPPAPEAGHTFIDRLEIQGKKLVGFHELIAKQLNDDPNTAISPKLIRGGQILADHFIDTARIVMKQSRSWAIQNTIPEKLKTTTLDKLILIEQSFERVINQYNLEPLTIQPKTPHEDLSFAYHFQINVVGTWSAVFNIPLNRNLKAEHEIPSEGKDSNKLLIDYFKETNFADLHSIQEQLFPYIQSNFNGAKGLKFSRLLRALSDLSFINPITLNISDFHRKITEQLQIDIGARQGWAKLWNNIKNLEPDQFHPDEKKEVESIKKEINYLFKSAEE